MLKLPEPVAGQGPRPLRRDDPFWWLRDRDALVRRFVLSQALGEPKSRQPPGPRQPPGSRQPGGRR